jgi:glycosyltransferase involved in cell wall biosynthesis
MRVAVIVRGLKIGGMERAAVDLAESFADAGDEAHLIYFKDKNRVLSPDKKVHFHHFNLDKTLKLTIVGFILLILAKLLNAIIRNSFFIYNGLLLAPVFSYKLSKLESKFGKFDLIVIRGHGTFELIWPFKDDRVVQMVESVFIRDGSWLDRLYIRSVYSGKNLAGVSNGVKTRIEEVLKSNSVEAKSVNVINNPLNVKEILKKAHLYTPDIDEEYIVSIGRVTPNKNISFLLESYSYARLNLGLKLPLVIVGDGHDMKNIRQKIDELDLSLHVKLLGLLSNPYPWLKNAKLFCITSKAEGGPTVVLEALACHTKVVATRSRGGISDIMSGELESYLIDFDIKEFGSKIVQAVNEDVDIEYDRYIKRYTPETIVKRYKELFL